MTSSESPPPSLARASAVTAVLCVAAGARAAPAAPPSGGSIPKIVVSTSSPAPITQIAAESDELDYDTSRSEPAGFPLLGGDSDIGFEFGGVGTFTRFGGGLRPYVWNMDLLLAASVKSGPNGAEITQQNYLWQLDWPGLDGGQIRVNPAVSYERTINHGYYGIGNASSPTKPGDILGNPGRYFQFDDREARVRELTRFAWRPPWDIMLATTFRYDTPVPYSGSKLVEDASTHAVTGVEDTASLLVGAGVVYDTRDNEYFPRKGSYHQIGVRLVQAFPIDANIHYGAFGAMLATYQPIAAGVVLAARGVVDAQFGNVPFFDLYTGGPFRNDEMIGGPEAIRGVPSGRYLGPLKVLGNLELRRMLFDVHILGEAFHFGGDLLFDAGRLWSDYTFRASADGNGLGLKWGAGGGLYLIWGQAGVFRIDVAYSPDAVSENPNLPLGIYVQDGVMF